MIDVDGAFNFRDLGGGFTADGRPLATGRIYRSASLDSLTDRGLATIERLGVRTVIDLRSRPEIDRNGRFPLEGLPVRWIHVASPFGPPTGPDDPRARILLEHPDPMMAMFRMMVTDGRRFFVDALREIGAPDAPPVVFHCTSGKDRTGLLALLIQLVAGMDLEDALVDFEYSAEAVRLAGHDMAAQYPGMSSWPPERVARMSGADRSWVLGALEEIGGIDQVESWLDANGVDVELRGRLSAQLGC